MTGPPKQSGKKHKGWEVGFLESPSLDNDPSAGSPTEQLTIIGSNTFDRQLRSTITLARNQYSDLFAVYLPPYFHREPDYILSETKGSHPFLPSL